MNARKITQDFPLFLPEPNTPRSKGIHVSGIIRCIATEAGILKPEWADELSLVDVRQITDPTAILRISIGLAWEEYYIPKILGEYGVLDHPGEMQYEGIYMTHDAEDVAVIITLNRCIERVHEVKATYKSVNTVGDLSSQWMWLTQMKAYCLAKGTHIACLHILFICGDYKFPIRPVREVWEIEFSEEELMDTGKLLVDYRNYRIGLEMEK